MALISHSIDSHGTVDESANLMYVVDTVHCNLDAVAVMVVPLNGPMHLE